MTEPACCPHCGQPLLQADPVTRLRQVALERGFYVSPADEVRTDAAAWLLGVQSATLRQDRCYFGRIPCRRVGGRVVYRLADLAERLFPSMQRQDDEPTLRPSFHVED